MLVLRPRNVHEALPEGLRALSLYGYERESRNGKVIEFPEPVTTVYEKPRERVIFWPTRDANPFFHFFESLWMLGGRNDVNYVAYFVKRMRTFSDDGATFWGAYGHRWRQWFTYDQLEIIIDKLTRFPEDRRIVLSMWDGELDLVHQPEGKVPKDLPCNTHAYFRVSREGKLDMTVCNRSNDMVWGAYGANAVHFSFLQEYLACRLGREVGTYTQVSNNMHGYVDTLEKIQWEKLREFSVQWGLGPARPNPYAEIAPTIFLMNGSAQQWEEDLQIFLHEGPIVGFREPFFRKVAVPMWQAHEAYKNKDYAGAADILLSQMDSAPDWKRACLEWIVRREEASRG